MLRGAALSFCAALAYASNSVQVTSGEHGQRRIRKRLGDAESYTLEVSILERLAKTDASSACSPRPFPTLFGRDDAAHAFTISWDGLTLDSRAGLDDFCQLPYKQIYHQASCMDALLHQAHVRHLAAEPKNVAIRKNRLTLFDFDVAQLDSQPEALNARRAAAIVDVLVPLYEDRCGRVRRRRLRGVV